MPCFSCGSHARPSSRGRDRAVGRTVRRRRAHERDCVGHGYAWGLCRRGQRASRWISISPILTHGSGFAELRCKGLMESLLVNLKDGCILCSRERVLSALAIRGIACSTRGHPVAGLLLEIFGAQRPPRRSTSSCRASRCFSSSVAMSRI